MSNFEKNNLEFYVFKPTGEMILVEIFNNNDCVSLVFGGKRLDLNPESAFDLADALLMSADSLRDLQ